MINYTPLWATMERRNVSTYTLRGKYNIPPGTISRLRKNKPVTTQTLNCLCMILGCTIGDVIEYVHDEKEKKEWLSERIVG